MKRCYLIGGGGFIGCHLAALLSRTNRRVTIVGRTPVTGELPAGVSFICADYGEERISRIIAKDANEIVLLAYGTVPKTSYDDPILDITENLPPAVRLFEMAASAKVERLVFVSSGGTVYGRAAWVPLGEHHPTDPISPYGITKLALEKYAMMYYHSKGLPVICVRPGNAYGEGQQPFAGQGFVATAIASVLAGKEIPIFGEQGAVRDYLHVFDVAGGIAAVLDRGAIGTTYNVGTGIGRNNIEVLNAIAPFAADAHLEVSVRFFPDRSFDVPFNILDSTKLKADTGWSPVLTFEEGIRRTWDWFRENRIRFGLP